MSGLCSHLLESGALGTERAAPKQAPEQGEHLLFGFLTTAANGVIAPVHAKAMPVILQTAEECDAWLTVDPTEALKMQRPLPDDVLKIVATGEKEDPPPAPAHVRTCRRPRRSYRYDAPLRDRLGSDP